MSVALSGITFTTHVSKKSPCSLQSIKHELVNHYSEKHRVPESCHSSQDRIELFIATITLVCGTRAVICSVCIITLKHWSETLIFYSSHV